jgi:8-oxo-dGTP diphosphatase
MKKPLHEVAELRITAECCVISGDYVLVQQRSVSSKFFPGFLSFPGGHVDEGEDIASSVIREVFEETGVTINPQSLKLRVSAVNHHVDSGKIWCAFGFFAEVDNPAELKSKEEEGQAMWMSKQEFLKSDKVFPPIAHYLKHLFNSDKVLYMSAECEGGHIKRVTSEVVI